MRGYPSYNFPAFHAMAAALRANGHEVFSPAERDEQADGFNAATDTALPMSHYMAHDTDAVLSMGAVAVLPGWEKSSGARLEVHLAAVCGFPVYRAESLVNGSAPHQLEIRIDVSER